MTRTLLHVGSGHATLPGWFSDYAETRLDIDPGCKPDVVANITDMGEIGQFDAVYCSHTLEHLYPHELPVALAECKRVLKPSGAFMAFVPDLDGIKATEDVVYQSPCGPITGMDMIYGKVTYLQESPHMAHHNGFVSATLAKALELAGFDGVAVLKVPDFNLMGTGRA